jgi:hypothetical protein
MSEFEYVLQECLHEIEQGASNVEECLQRHPRHAAQLEPILLTSAYLARGREARLSPAFQARVRTRLIQQMHVHPRRLARPRFMFMRLTASLAAVMLAFLIAGSVYAQRAMPGETFHAWKIASENAWRLVSPDPLGTDLAIAERRLEELIAVRNDPVLQAQALAAYLQVTDRLRSQMDPANEARILAVLDAQAEELSQLEILPEEPAPNIVPPFEVPTATLVETPLPILETPQVNPTQLPEIVPTVEVVPELLPTVQDPPKLIPTLEIPPPIP